MEIKKNPNDDLVKRILFIQGPVSEIELENLRLEISIDDFQISKSYELSSTPQEFINLLFHDYTIIAFTRDYLIGKVVDSVVKKVIDIFDKKEKRVQNITITLKVKYSEELVVTVKLSSSDKNFDLLIEKSTEIILSQLKESLENIISINICIDDNCELKIFKQPKI